MTRPTRARHLLVIGAQRCGTTYLHRLLDAHPDITMARPSRPEPKVFCSDELTARGADWYRATYFAHAGPERLLGDKSTSYLDTPEAPERAAAMLGDPLVLVQLRDPIERAVSHWRFSTDHGVETRPLADALTDELEHGPPAWDRSRTSVSPFEYVRRGEYARTLAPWRDRFGPDVVISLLDELVTDPGAVGDLYARLGVDPSVRPDVLGERVNASERPADGSPEDDLDDTLITRLRDHYAADEDALARLLGRDLPWRRGTGSTDPDVPWTQGDDP